jgi:cytoskeletal protein RodZ
VSVGEALSEARSQAGLSVAQVSQRTRIRESIVRAVEQNDFSPCGGDFYARGHIRSLAECVGIDPAPLVREYDAEHPPAGITAAEAFKPATPIKIREPRQHRFPVGVVAIAAVLAVIGYGSYRLVATPAGHTGATPTATVVPAVKASSKAATPKASPSPSATHAPARRQAVVVLTASQDCWVNVTLPNGQQVYQGTILAGKSQKWTEQHKVDIVIGNPSATKIKVDGKAVKPNTVQVVTLAIDPSSKYPVSLAAPAGATLTTTGG